MIKRLAAIAAVALCAAPAAAADVSPSPVETRWASGLEFFSPFGPCQMNCMVTGYVGRYVDTPMSDIFASFSAAPWDWKFKNSTFVGGTFSREVVRYGDWWAFETEIGAGKRFGKLDAFESWAALYWRWKAFPWNDYVRTTIGVSTGLNWASEVDRVEREKSSHTSQVLHFLSPEITFGLPSNENLDLVFRFHHRSGGKLSVFKNTSGAAQYQSIGLRYRW
jgi:hypothetical protein